MDRTVIVHKVVIRGSIADVWREITRTDAPQKAVFNMRMHSSLEAGAPIYMRTPNGRYTGVVGRVLAVEPPHRFSHTMKFTQYDDPEVRVTYELKEVEGGVEFTLRVDDVPVGTKTAKDMTGGAAFICNNLKAIVEKGDVGVGVRLAYAFFKLTEPFSPARLKTEHWS